MIYSSKVETWEKQECWKQRSLQKTLCHGWPQQHCSPTAKILQGPQWWAAPSITYCPFNLRVCYLPQIPCLLASITQHLGSNCSSIFRRLPSMYLDFMLPTDCKALLFYSHLPHLTPSDFCLLGLLFEVTVWKLPIFLPWFCFCHRM